MKRIFIVFLTAALLMTGCSAANPADTQSQDMASQPADQQSTVTPEGAQTEAPVVDEATPATDATAAAEATIAPDATAAVGEQKDKGSIGKIDVEIVSAKADKTADGKDAVVVELKWKNNTDKATAFKLTLNVDVTQNGTKCEPAELDQSSAVNTTAGNQELDGGGKEQTVWMVYAIADKSNIDVAVTERFAFEGGEKITKTLEIQ